MDEELEHEKAAIDALITKFSVLMDQVNDLQRDCLESLGEMLAKANAATGRTPETKIAVRFVGPGRAETTCSYLLLDGRETQRDA